MKLKIYTNWSIFFQFCAMNGQYSAIMCMKRVKLGNNIYKISSNVDICAINMEQFNKLCNKCAVNLQNCAIIFIECEII